VGGGLRAEGRKGVAPRGATSYVAAISWPCPSAKFLGTNAKTKGSQTSGCVCVCVYTRCACVRDAIDETHG